MFKNAAKQTLAIGWKTLVFVIFILFFHFKTVYQYGSDFYPWVVRFDTTLVAAALAVSLVLLGLFWLPHHFASLETKVLLLFLAWQLFCTVRCGAFSVPNFLNVIALTLLAYAIPFLFKAPWGNRLFVGAIVIPYLLYRLPPMLYGWYAFLTKIPVYFCEHGPDANIGFGDNRLAVFWDPNETAITLGTACMLCLLGFFVLRNLVAKVFFALSFAISFITLALAGSRTTSITLALAVALVVAYGILTVHSPRPRVRDFVLAVLGAVLCLVMLLSLSAPITRLFTAWQSPVAFDETAVVHFTKVDWGELSELRYNPDVTVQERTSTVEGAFNGREYTWRAGIALLQRNPTMWLTGAHVETEQYIQQIFEDTGIYYGHMHSSYMHLLLAYGLPGILIMAVLFVQVCLRCLYLLFQPRNMATAVAMATLCMILINDTMEPFFVNHYGRVFPILLLYSCGVVCANTPDYTLKNLGACLRGARQPANEPATVA